MTTTTDKPWPKMNTYEQAAHDLDRALAEAKTARERDEIRAARRAVIARATPAAARAAVYLPASAVAPLAPAAVAAARPVYAYRQMRVCSYCGARTSSAMCCGDETVPS